MYEREVCGTCGHSVYDWMESDYVCKCSASECHTCCVGYSDHCEEWCEK